MIVVVLVVACFSCFGFRSTVDSAFNKLGYNKISEIFKYSFLNKDIPIKGTSFHFSLVP